jgi:hypothetical protein
MRNKKTAARIQAALERSRAREDTEEVPNQSASQKIEKLRCIVDRRMGGERNWKIGEIAERENLGYMTVYRALKGKPGWFSYGRTLRVTDTLYRAWLGSIQFGMSVDQYLILAEAF